MRSNLQESNNHIIESLAAGKTVKEIAAEMEKPVRTVEDRIKKMRKKYNCRTAIQLVYNILTLHIGDAIRKP